MELDNKNHRDYYKNGARGTTLKNFIGDSVKRKKKTNENRRRALHALNG